MCLADAFAAGHGDVAATLAAYTAAWRRHLDYYQLATRALTPFFQGDSRVLGVVRDLVFPASRWLAPLRRRMVRPPSHGATSARRQSGSRARRARGLRRACARPRLRLR